MFLQQISGYIRTVTTGSKLYYNHFIVLLIIQLFNHNHISMVHCSHYFGNKSTGVVQPFEYIDKGTYTTGTNLKSSVWLDPLLNSDLWSEE